ncbi:MAG: ABC-F family ATP-binding cassette domain-containing protein, partial [Oligoflexia bacterium]|nr:ABC-F family ATP-binding cassette domain-containing protein [Oligoflexia bacterium]
MITITGISKSFGGQTLFENASLKINKGERVGLVGRNGHGKSTLLKMICGEEEYSDGSIVKPRNYKTGFLRQTLSFTENTAVDECCLSLDETERDAAWKAEKILTGLGFTEDMLRQNPLELSGGFQVRLNLAKLLVQKLDMLLLDEPNNYLDITSIRWLSDFLKKFRGEIILVTHDRAFMDSVVTHIAGIHRQRIRKIQGTTAKYYDSIEQEEEIHEKTRINEERKIRQMETFINKFRAKARQANMVQSRIKTLEKIKPLGKLSKIKNLNFNFNEAEFNGKFTINVRDISFGYEKGHELIRDLGFCGGYGDKICVIGKNGKGKTTLLKILSGALGDFGAEQLAYSANTKTAYYEQTNVVNLQPDNTVIEEIMLSSENIDMQTARNICGTMMFEDDNALKTISVLSGGEKCRVLLGKIMATPCNLLLLDEPTNHLDMDSCNSLLEALKIFGGTSIIVTHNEFFLRELAEKLIIFDNDTVTFFDGTYDLFLEKTGWNNEPEAGGKTSQSGRGKKQSRAAIIQ